MLMPMMPPRRLAIAFTAAMVAVLLALVPRTAAAKQATVADSPPQPTAEAVYARMSDALAPERAVLSRVRFAVWLDDDQQRTYDARVARQRGEDGVLTTVAIVEPELVRGTSMLWGTTRGDGEPVEAVYRPVDRRVTEIAPVLPDDAFLGSDFTRADLGFVPRGALEVRLVGKRTLDQREVWVVEATPKDSWYYSRIVTWVDGWTWLPVKREYYDRAGRLWKRAEYQGTIVEDVPVLTRLTMEDVQAMTRSDLVVTELRFGGEEVEALFRRTYLAKAAEHLAEALPDRPPAPALHAHRGPSTPATQN